MKTYDFTVLTKDLEGNVIQQTDGKPLEINKLLGNMIVTSFEKVSDPIKFFQWGKQIYSKGKIQLDSSSVNELKTFVTNNQNYNLLVKNAILECLSNPVEEVLAGKEE